MVRADALTSVLRGVWHVPSLSEVRALGRRSEEPQAWLLENMHDAAAAPAARVDFPMVVVRKSAREEADLRRRPRGRFGGA